MNKEQIEKGIRVIDAVSKGIVEGTINTEFLQKSFYGHMDLERYNHVINKWKGKEGDFFDFYLNAGDLEKRLILENLGIQVEPDKYDSYEKRVFAKLAGKGRFEIYPFETEVLHQHFLYCYNHSMECLRVVSNTAYRVILDNNIELYGDFKNWSLFWVNASPEDKGKFLEYIFKGN